MNLAGILTGVRFTIRHPDTDKPLSFGKVYTYEDNSLIPKDTWKDENKKAINTNPIILDASGQCDLFLDGVYRIVVKDNNDLIINTIDRVRDGATVAREFAEELINGYAQLNLDPTILNPVAENTVNIVAIGENIDSVVTDALNIEAIKTNALNINSINTNATNIATIQTASANAIIAEQQAQIATIKASESLVNANNAKASELLSAQYKADNESIKTNVQTLSNSAYDSANTASIKANEASNSAIVSTTQANISTAKASEASTYATNSNTSAVNASVSENKAEEWANKGYGLEVEPGLYSAKHYAITAQTVLNNKVDKVSGKGLSTEDYTTADKTKLAGLSNYTLPIASTTVLGGVKAGTNISIDANGVISANDTSIAWSEITSKPTTLSGYGITDSIQSTLVSGTSIKTINGTSILGSGDISTIQTTITGNAGTATKLQTARTIGGVSFDGTANINLPGVDTAGNQNTTGNAGTATKLQTARTINGVSFDGTADITIADNTKVPLNGTGATGTWGINISGNSSTATTLTGLTATIAELNYNGGVTSNIQTQLNNKASNDIVTTTTNGLMASTDKVKLNSLGNYTLPNASATTLGGIKVGSNLSIDANGVLNALAASSISWTNITDKPTTISGYGITDAYTKTEVGTLAEFTTNLG